MTVDPRPAAAPYDLVDFGGGRKLERFAGFLLDRPDVAALGRRACARGVWQEVHAIYDSDRAGRGAWRIVRPMSRRWFFTHDDVTLELKLTPFGHIGLFAELPPLWTWLREFLRRSSAAPRVLNLFAHTGGMTLAAAAAGAQVTHVDSAHNVVAWARRNAELSCLEAAPIRWIVDDALEFVLREARRGRTYHVVVADPPAFGHGRRGRTWRLESGLSELAQACAAVLDRGAVLFAVSCHSSNLTAARLRRALTDSTGRPFASGNLTIPSTLGRELSCGTVACWPPEAAPPANPRSRSRVVAPGCVPPEPASQHDC